MFHITVFFLSRTSPPEDTLQNRLSTRPFKYPTLTHFHTPKIPGFAQWIFTSNWGLWSRKAEETNHQSIEEIGDCKRKIVYQSINLLNVGSNLSWLIENLDLYRIENFGFHRNEILTTIITSETCHTKRRWANDIMDVFFELLSKHHHWGVSSSSSGSP